MFTAVLLGASAGVSRAETADFLQQAMQNSMTEVELGKLAGTNARSTGINAFGARLARDHARIGKILELISRDKGVTLATDLDAEHRAIVNRMSGFTGAKFDIAYADLMVSDHEQAITLFTQASQSDDADLAEFARRALPALREQKRLADTFQKMTSTYPLESVANPD